VHRHDFSRKSRRNPHPKGRRDAPAAGPKLHGLARCISKLGFASRSEATRLIRAGRVSVGRAAVRDPERPTDPAREAIAIDGRPLGARERLYYAMHKPVGPVTTCFDPEGRETVYDLLPPFDAWIFPVGRLDAKTSGLLLFTNDSAFADALAGDRFKVEKRYEAVVRGFPSEAALESLRAGVEIAGEDGAPVRTRPARVEALPRASRGNGRVAITIREGKNRQVRRMLAAVGHEVMELRRTRVGPLELGDLPCGATRALSLGEVEALLAAARGA
jgi:23S rRNA pseudouridine2605 synthase